MSSSKNWIWGAAALASGWWATYRRPLQKAPERLSGPPFQGPVALDFCARGIPRLRVAHWLDGWRALGWLHGRDRPFQMDLQRCLAQGRLCELFGRRSLRADQFLRKLDLVSAARREWELADTEERAILRAYAEGVNLAWRRGPRASEFVLLAYQPQEWLPEDSFYWFKLLSHDLGCNWDSELLRSAAWANVDDPELMAPLSLLVPDGLPAHHGRQTKLPWDQLLMEYSSVKASLPAGWAPTHPLPGSNAWVVDGKRSKTGLPLLANDPHLVMRCPDYWYQVALEVDGLELFGASMVGLPGVILGQNGHLSWGVTNAYVDIQDVYLEEVHWQTGELRAGGQIESVPEEIKIRGARPLSWTRYLTPRGPLLTGDPSSPLALSLAWSGREGGHFFRALSRLNASRSVQQARQALADWHAPVLNFLLADRQHIAHQLVGRIPRRKRASGLLVAPAWEAEWQWDGWLDYRELPAQQDPESGYLISANHSLESPHFLSWDFNPGFRAERIEELLLAEPLHDLDSFARIQCDQVSTLARRWLTQVPLLSAHTLAERQALAWLSTWDGHMQAESSAPTVYQSWLYVVATKMCENRIGSKAARWIVGQVGFHPLDPSPCQASRYQAILVKACLERQSGWTGDLAWPQFLQACFEVAVSRLQERLGAPPWPWGRLHQLQIPHPLGQLGPLFRSPGPLAVGGDSETINQTGSGFAQGLPGPVTMGASWRFLSDLSSPRAVRTAHCPGQSGHVGSPNFRDGVSEWLNFTYYQPLLQRNS